MRSMISSRHGGASRPEGGRHLQSQAVALGWGQVPGVDCGGTFSPVCRIGSNSMLLAVVVANDLETH